MTYHNQSLFPVWGLCTFFFSFVGFFSSFLYLMKYSVGGAAPLD